MDVSIVIPVFNRRNFIEKTVESILKSGVPFRQLILVDNGSTDGSWELVQTFPSRFEIQITVVREMKPGAAAARNKGLSLCRSKWVYFFDSDDIFTGFPDEWDEKADLVCFPTCMDIDGKIIKRSFVCDTRPHTQILSLMLNTQGMIFNAGFLHSICGWNEDCMVWNDWELGIRALIKANNVQLLPEKAYHRILIHPDSITGANFSSRHQALSKALSIAFDDVSAIADSKNKKKSLQALYYRICILCGEYRREGHKEIAADTYNQFADKFRPNKKSIFIGRFMTFYVAIGGRGAWRLALKAASH